MTELLQPNGEIITDESKIIKEVHAYYSNMYSTDTGFKENQMDAMEIILEHTDKLQQKNRNRKSKNYQIRKKFTKH
jgi:hypothetical protein